MSPAVLIDSVVVIGAFLESDQHHDEASDIFDGIDEGNLPPAVIHDYVYTEIVNYLTNKMGSRIEELYDILNRLDSAKNFRIYRVNNDHFRRGKEDIYFKYDELSLTDAISVSFMENMGVEYMYSFDDDFDSVDSIARINSATSPY